MLAFLKAFLKTFFERQPVTFNICRRCKERPVLEHLGKIYDTCFSCWHDEIFQAMPRHIRTWAIRFLRDDLSENVKRRIRAEIAKDPDGWFSGYHFGWGMAMRNHLRTNICADDKLPTGNWDDYYVKIVEKAVEQ